MWASRWKYWRRFNLPHLVYLLVLIGLAGLSYWWVRQDGAQTANAEPVVPERMDGYAQKVELTQASADGVLRYHAAMDRVQHFGNQNIQGQNVTLESTAKGQPKVVVRAQLATWHHQEKFIELSGDVWLLREPIAGEGSVGDNPAMRLHTEALRVDMVQGVATGAGSFEWQQGERTISGARFVYDYQLRELSMGVVNDPTKGAQPVGGRVRAVFKNAFAKPDRASTP